MHYELVEIKGEKDFVDAVKFAGRRCVDGIFKRNRRWMATKEAIEKCRQAYSVSSNRGAFILHLKAGSSIALIESIGDEGLIVKGRAGIVPCLAFLGIPLNQARRLFPHLANQGVASREIRHKASTLSPQLFQVEEAEARPGNDQSSPEADALSL